MKNTFFIIFLIFIYSNNSIAQESTFKREKINIIKRINKIKECTGKILVDDVKTGTGFFISSNGLVLTNWHVVFGANTKFDSLGNVKSKFSFVNHKNDTIPLKMALKFKENKAQNQAVIWDYYVLITEADITTNFLKLGNFSEAYEGATVYTCGFPLKLNEPFFSKGLISTITSEFFKGNYKREVALLDMTTNKGNSGGPLVLQKENPEDDVVIGITSYIVTPNYSSMLKLNNYVTNIKKTMGSPKILGIDLLEYMKLVTSTINSNSVGISGGISIQKVKEVVGTNNK